MREQTTGLAMCIKPKNIEKMGIMVTITVTNNILQPAKHEYCMLVLVDIYQLVQVRSQN
jgi:hypothetical protein